MSATLLQVLFSVEAPLISTITEGYFQPRE